MHAASPIVSVIIPTYNRRDFVLEAIASVERQTFQDLEIVVVDDGSKDGTKEAVTRLSDSRIRFVEKAHSGIAATRNRGLQEARGEVFAFLDSDDQWVPEKLTKQLPLLRGDVGFGYARYRSVKGGETLRSKPIGGPSGWIFLDLLSRIFVQTSTAVVRREAAQAVGPFDESLSYADEYDYFLRLAERFRAGFVDEDLVIYRIHEGNESRDHLRRISENLEVYRRIFGREDLVRRTRRIAGGRVARYAIQLGYCLFEEGDREGAVRSFREALRARPLSLAARRGLWKARGGRSAAAPG
ncbi:MAG: glycosyltransferase family 2 protein [Planctomycetota bacterium]|jgi:glycosyltransferase involved in cell wall biosynthesis